MLALLLAAAMAIPYSTPDPVMQTVAVSQEGRQLAFWSETPKGGVATCFAQQFSVDGGMQTGARRVFDLQPNEERRFSRSGAALWLDEYNALMLVAAYQQRSGNQLLVQRWRRTGLTQPALVSNATEIGLWESLVRSPSGEIYAVWQEEKRAFSICARRITPDGQPEGPIVKLQKVFELATPGAISAAATSKVLCLAWSEMHSHESVVYFAQFDCDGVRIGEPQRVFDAAAGDPHILIHNGEVIVQALTVVEQRIVLRPIGGDVTTGQPGPRVMKAAINSAGEPAFVWMQGSDAWIRVGNKQQRIAEYVEAGFLALEPTGPSTWRVHFRRLPPRSAPPSLGLAFADYNANSGS